MPRSYERTVMRHAVRSAALSASDIVGYVPAVGWPEDMVELLKRLVVEGLSGGQIAQAINGSGRWPKLRKTRNAIIGKINRLGIGGSKPLRETVTAARLKVKSQVWSPQLDERILRLYGEGLKPGAIAADINAAFGCEMTHQTIRFRLIDLGVFKKASGEIMKHKRSRKAGFHAEPTIVEIVEQAPETSVHSHSTNSSMCQWPTSDAARDMHVCGQKAVEGAYCARHALIAYRQPPSRRRAALFHRRNEFDL